jgi:hypothetical protein
MMADRSGGDIRSRQFGHDGSMDHHVMSAGSARQIMAVLDEHEVDGRVAGG